jgi:hypothetical protein
MERGHVFITVNALGGEGEITFQCFIATSDEAGKHLHDGFRHWRERYGCTLLRTVLCTEPGFGEDGLREKGGNLEG